MRALVVDIRDGRELGTAVINYPSGKEGILLDPRDHNLARQFPGDYLVGLEISVRSALAQAAESPGFSPDQVIGIGIDTTGSSPLPVNASNMPLALHDQWRGNFAVQCWLWKDHTSHREAARITEVAGKMRPHYIAKCGNTYSSEWFWSKIWRCLAVAPEVFDAAYSWVELADFIPSVLAGVTEPGAIVRGVCCAGHKALYHEDWNGLPDKEFLATLDPKLAALRDRLYERAYDATTAAGQSAVGDIFKWWVNCICQGDSILHADLTRQAAAARPGVSGLLALDWNNGNRTILVHSHANRPAHRPNSAHDSR